MLYEIDLNSAYYFITSACLIGFLFGIYNWYSVNSIELKNEADEKGELQQIDDETLKAIIKFSEHIRKVKN